MYSGRNSYDLAQFPRMTSPLSDEGRDTWKSRVQTLRLGEMEHEGDNFFFNKCSRLRAFSTKREGGGDTEFHLPASQTDRKKQSPILVFDFFSN